MGEKSFGEALQGWPTGVYYGFAVIDPPEVLPHKGISAFFRCSRGWRSWPQHFSALVHESFVKAKQGRAPGFRTVHKAVANIGFSPTFEGQENREKIVEAHLILPRPDDNSGGISDEGIFGGDFYGCTMRLVLVGSLRPEMKFESFPALVKQITQVIFIS